MFPAKTPAGKGRRATPEVASEAAAETGPSKTPRKRAAKQAPSASSASEACLAPGGIVELDRCKFEVGDRLAAGADSTIFRGRWARLPFSVCCEISLELCGATFGFFDGPLRLVWSDRRVRRCAGVSRERPRAKRWRSRSRRGSRRPCIRYEGGGLRWCLAYPCRARCAALSVSDKCAPPCAGVAGRLRTPTNASRFLFEDGFIDSLFRHVALLCHECRVASRWAPGDACSHALFVLLLKHRNLPHTASSRSLC